MIDSFINYILQKTLIYKQGMTFLLLVSLISLVYPVYCGPYYHGGGAPKIFKDGLEDVKRVRMGILLYIGFTRCYYLSSKLSKISWH